MFINNFEKRQFHVNKYSSFMLLTLLFTLVSCAPFTKEKYIEDLRSFVGETKESYVNYSDKDWDKADEQFNQLTVEQYNKIKQNLTDEDKVTIGKLKGVYVALKLKKGAKTLMDQAKDILNQAQGAIEEVLDTTKTKSK